MLVASNEPKKQIANKKASSPMIRFISTFLNLNIINGKIIIPAKKLYSITWASMLKKDIRAPSKEPKNAGANKFPALTKETSWIVSTLDLGLNILIYHQKKNVKKIIADETIINMCGNISSI